MTTAELTLAIALAILALAAGFALGWMAKRNRLGPVAGGQPSSVPTARPDGARTAGGQVAYSEARREGPAAEVEDVPAERDATGMARQRRATTGSSQRPLPAAGAPVLKDVKSWGYQLQNLDVRRAAASPFDLLVIDYSKDGGDEGALKPAEMERLKVKPDGGRRLVLAYLSIGEAESYRSYWRDEWKRQKPSWLLRENPEWKENYAVCFWEPGWQELFCGAPGAYLDRILAQGFDGIYLDKCDVVDDLREHERKAAASRKDLDGDMVRFVDRLAGYARSKRPEFLVIMQNAEHLLERAELRRLIDGVGKEELLFGVDGGEKPNTRDETEWSRERLDLVRKDGKAVLVVEYLNDRAKIAKAAEEIRRLGYVLYISDKNRELDKLHYTTLEA